MTKVIQRCHWVNLNNPLYIDYHDHEWGRPVFDDQKLFELLILEGAQAGLSWETILNKRSNYQKLFKNFNINLLSKISDDELESVLLLKEIVRNRLKVFSVRINAIKALELIDEFGSLYDYFWSHTNYQIIHNTYKNIENYPVRSDLSDYIAKDLKQRGFKFVGTKIIFAYLEAIGIYQNHSFSCYLRDLEFIPEL